MFREIVKYKELLYFLVHREIRIRYRNSLFGFFWSLLEPLGLMIIYTIVFSFILRFNVDNYALFVLSGLIPWMFLSQSIQKGTKSLTNNSALIRKIYFPRQIFPFTTIIANMVNFIPALLIVLVFAFVSGAELNWLNMIYLPFIILIQAVFVYGIVLILAIINVYYRDVEFIFNLFNRGWMYLSPIIYPLYAIPSAYLDLYMLNPMAVILDMYRAILYGSELGVSTLQIAYAVACAIIIFIGAWFLFKRLNRRVGEVI
jgi:ABC-2 type transport system permease protein